MVCIYQLMGNLYIQIYNLSAINVLLLLIAFDILVYRLNKIEIIRALSPLNQIFNDNYRVIFISYSYEIDRL